MDESYDVVVVGGGAAGLAGAVALARSRRSVLVVDAGEPRNAPADHVHNFLTRDGTPPPGSLQQQRSTVTSPPRTPSVRSARHPGHRQPRRVIEARRTLPLMRGIR